jgi:hypothetical protein
MKTIQIVIAAVLLSASASASADPFAGKWVLDVQRSKYPTGARPKSMMIEMEPVGRAIRYHSETTYANGRTTQANYSAEYNGQQAVVMGAHRMMLPVTLKKIDSRTVVASYSRLLQVVATSRRVVSADGRSMTITTVSKDLAGKRITTIGVYEKQRAQPSAAIPAAVAGASRPHM